MDFTAPIIKKYIEQLRDAGLSNDQITDQLKSKGFDPYEPPVSQRVNQQEYAKWRRASIESGAELAADRPMIDQELNYRNLKNINSLDSSYNINNKTNLEGRIAANNAKFSNINKAAVESLYEANPQYRGNFGRANVGQLVELPLYYAAEKALEIPSAEASELPPDIQSQKDAYNKEYIRRKFGN